MFVCGVFTSNVALGVTRGSFSEFAQLELAFDAATFCAVLHSFIATVGAVSNEAEYLKPAYFWQESTPFLYLLVGPIAKNAIP